MNTGHTVPDIEEPAKALDIAMGGEPQGTGRPRRAASGITAAAVFIAVFAWNAQSPLSASPRAPPGRRRR